MTPATRAGVLRVAALLALAAAGSLLAASVYLWLIPPGAERANPESALPQWTAAEWLAGHSADWRVGRLRGSPEVLVIEFPSLAEQGAAMNRMAALLEKDGAPRDRLLDDAELANLIARSGDTPPTFYQGHDYDSTGLAHFYALARAQPLALNRQEQRLAAVLQAAGMLPGPAADQVSGTSQALITFTSTQTDDPTTPLDERVDMRRRESVFRHESSHGVYYTQAAYRDHCRRFWSETLSERQREAFRAYLASLGYDRSNEDLMLNEAQAFLMHTPDERAFNGAAVGLTEDELAELRLRFWRSLPAPSPQPGGNR